MANFFFPEFNFPNQRSSNDGPLPTIDPSIPAAQFPIPVGEMITPHVHPNSDEILEVISGTGIGYIITDIPADPQGLFRTQVLTAPVGPGDFLFFARGVVHGLLNTSDIELNPRIASGAVTVPVPGGAGGNPPNPAGTAPSSLVEPVDTSEVGVDLVVRTSFENAGFDTLLLGGVEDALNLLNPNVFNAALSAPANQLVVPF